MEDKIQRQRFEMKYRISEPKAQQIRFFVQNYLECDHFGKTQPNLSYPVHSLYLDSPALKTYHDTINGSRNRYKLRIRYYEKDNSPVYFEIKRRYKKVIHKKRAKVHRHYVHDLLSGQVPTYNHLAGNSAEQMETLEYFCYLQNQLQANPKIHVSYEREAYEKQDSNSVRITMDRNVLSHKETDFKLSNSTNNPISVFGNTVILELKFTDRFPHWFEELTQHFHLRQESAAKYVDGIIKMKEKKFQMS